MTLLFRLQDRHNELVALNHNGSPTADLLMEAYKRIQEMERQNGDLQKANNELLLRARKAEQSR